MYGRVNGIQLRGAGDIGHVGHHTHPLYAGSWWAGRALGSLVVVWLAVVAAELGWTVGGFPRGDGAGARAPCGCTHRKHLDSQTINYYYLLHKWRETRPKVYRCDVLTT